MNNLEISGIRRFLIKNNINVIYNENISDLEKIKEIDGNCVYIITTMLNERYIGSTFNIYTRICQHQSSKLVIKEPIKNVSVYITENREDAYLLEDRMIYVLNPELNTVGKSKSYYDVVHDGFKFLSERIRIETKNISYLGSDVHKLMLQHDKSGITEERTAKDSVNVHLENDVYKVVLQKQVDIFEKSNKKVTLQKIVAVSVLKGIDFIEPEIMEFSKNAHIV